MTASRPTLITSRTPIAVAVLSCALAVAATRVSAEDPPDRAATEAEIQALTDKIDALSSFRVVYDLSSKNNTGEMVLEYRDPEEGHLSVKVTPNEGDENAVTECWMHDGRFTCRMETPDGNWHGSASFFEPLEFAKHLRSELQKRLEISEGGGALSLTTSFWLRFTKDPKDPERVQTMAQLLCEDGRRPRVDWMLSKQEWKAARVAGDRIVVDVDECRYELSTATGFLVKATIAQAGTVTLRTIETEVDEGVFVPRKPARNSEDKSSELDGTVWRVGMEAARKQAYFLLAAQDESGKLDDDRLAVWKSVVTDHYATWMSTVSAKVIASQTSAVEEFLAWYAARRTAAGSDAETVAMLEAGTKTWRDKLEEGASSYVERLVTTLTIPADVKISNTAGERGLELEAEAVRAAGRKVLIDPLLSKLDDGVRAANENK